MPTSNLLRRPLLAAILAASAVGLVGASGGPGGQPPAHAAGAPANAQRSGLSFELIDQDFTFSGGESLRLVYRLTGDLASIAELTVPTTAPAGSADAPTTTAEPAATTTIPPAAAEPTAPTTTVPPPPPITVRIANFAPLTRIAGNETYLDNILGQSSLAGAFRANVDGVLVADIRDNITVLDNRSAILTLNVPTDLGGEIDLSGPESLEFPKPGLYPVRVQLLVDGDLAATHGTIVERIPGRGEQQLASSPVNLVVVANVPRPDGSTADQRRAAEQVERIVELTANIESPILAAIPPEMLADAVDGDDADVVANALANDELVALTRIDLDVSSAVAAGQGEVYARELRIGEETMTAALAKTPTRREVWIAADPLSADAAQMLRDLGVRYVVMTPALYAATLSEDLPESDRFVDVVLPDGETLKVIVLNGLSAQLTSDAADEALADATPTEWAVRALAEIVLDHRQSGRAVQRSRVISTPTLDAPDPRLIAALEVLAATTPDVQFAVASTLAGATDTQRSPGGETLMLPATAGPDLVGRLELINAAGLRLASAGSMLAPTDTRPQRWSDELDSLISTAITAAEAEATINGLLAEGEAIREAVVLPEPFTFNMTGRSDDITLRLGNLSAEPVDVVVKLSSSKLTFPDNDVRVTLRPNDTTEVQMPVRARSNGTSAITVEVATPLGETLGEPVTLTLRVNALTGLGYVLTGAFILMLLAWWFNNWKTKRRTGANDDSDDSGEGGRQDTTPVADH